MLAADASDAIATTVCATDAVLSFMYSLYSGPISSSASMSSTHAALPVLARNAAFHSLSSLLSSLRRACIALMPGAATDLRRPAPCSELVSAVEAASALLLVAVAASEPAVVVAAAFLSAMYSEYASRASGSAVISASVGARPWRSVKSFLHAWSLRFSAFLRASVASGALVAVAVAASASGAIDCRRALRREYSR